jgi:cytochrome c oxidase subunit I
LFGGAIFGIFAGFYYWWPKVFGHLLNEAFGKIHFWLMFIGFNLAFGPMHVVGLQGMPRRIYTYPEGMGWDLWNLVETVGAFTIAVSILVFLANVAISARGKREAGADPWDGRTLEWSTPSPPPEYNFAEIPLVRSRDDLWRRKYVERPEEEPARVFAGGADGHDAGDHDHAIHMPSPSYFPVLAAAGIPVMGYGAIYDDLRALVVVGALLVVFGLFGWVLEPSAEE